MTPAQHGAAIVGPSIGAAPSASGGGWVAPAEAAVSVAIVVALAILWWRTLRPAGRS